MKTPQEIALEAKQKSREARRSMTPAERIDVMELLRQRKELQLKYRIDARSKSDKSSA